jgi:hypothetical protein
MARTLGNSPICTSLPVGTCAAVPRGETRKSQMQLKIKTEEKEGLLAGDIATWLGL